MYAPKNDGHTQRPPATTADSGGRGGTGTRADTDSPLRQWARIRTICATYGIDRVTLWRWRKRYEIADRVVGGIVFVDEADVRGVIEGETPSREDRR